MACLLTWKNVLPVFLKSTRALLQVPHRKFTPGSCGDSSSRVPKQGNRSPETARNFLRSAFKLLKFFPQTEHLKTSFLQSIIEIIAIKTKYRSGDAILFSRSRLYGSAATRLRVQNSILLPQICLISLLYWSLSEGFLGWFEAFWVRNWRFYFSCLLNV